MESAGFTTNKVELAEVASELLDYLAALEPQAGAWLFAVPLEGREALRIVAGKEVHAPLLFTIEPTSKGILGAALLTGDIIRRDAHDAGGAWYEYELGVERVAVPVAGEESPIAAVAAYGPPGSLSLGVDQRIAQACRGAAPFVTAAVRLSAVEAEIATLRRMLAAVSSFADATSHEDLVAHILAASIELVGSENGSVMLFDDRDRSLHIAAATHLPADVVESTAVPLGEGISGWVAQMGKGTVINDADGRRAHTSGRRAMRSAVCVPMVADDGRLYGVINVGTTTASGVYTELDVSRLSALGGYAAKALAREPTRGGSAWDS